MSAELEHLMQAWNTAWLDKDAAAVEELMTDGYVHVAPNGEALERAAVLDVIRSPGYRLHGGTRTEVDIRPLGPDTAAVLHRWQGEGTFAGQFFKDDHRCTMICVRRDGRWQIALEHCSSNGA
jgi:uncharacterized protein (TIGR02246 family)